MDWRALARYVVRIEVDRGAESIRPGLRLAGSGFFVAPGWVATCAHVVHGASDVVVRAHREIADGPLAGRVAACSPPPTGGGSLWPFPDLALLELDAGAPAHPCVWLDADDPVGDAECLSWGFARREDGVEPVGSPASFTYEGVEGDEFLRLKAGQAAPGLSGSPLLCPSRRAVVGVVAASRDVGSALGGYAAPVSALLHGGPGVPEELASAGAEVARLNRAAVLRDRGAWHAVMPVEMPRGAVDSVWGEFARGLRTVPSELLRADFGVVPYLFREPDLQQAADWCQEVEPAGLAQVAGRGGSGKTRFGIELCKRMADRGWAAGFWDHKSALPAVGVPRLVVVDYAEAADPEALRALVSTARLTGSEVAPVRIVLLTRTRAGGRGDALEGLYEIAPAALRKLLNESLAAPVASHRLGLAERLELYQGAYTRFCRAWWGHEGTPIDTDVRRLLADERYGLPLEVLYEAHDRVMRLGLKAAPAAITGRAPVTRVLAHEQRYWAAMLPDAAGFDLELARAAVALATLAGASTPEQAGRLLEVLPALRGEPGAGLRTRVMAWVAELYDGPRLFNPLRPDRLGEALIASVLAEQTDGGVELISAVIGLPDDEQVEHALDVLARLAAADPGITSTLTRALAGSLRELAERATTQAAPRSGKRINRALAASLTRLLAGPLISLESDHAAPHTQEATYRYTLGIVHEQLGDMARDAGRLEEARDHFSRKLKIDEQLAAADPDNPTYQHALGIDHQRLGDMARNAGQLEKAHDHYTRMLAIDEQLAAADPDNPTYRHALGIDHERLGDLARDAGQLEEAHDHYTRSLRLYEPLAAAYPDNPTYCNAPSVPIQRLRDLPEPDADPS